MLKIEEFTENEKVSLLFSGDLSIACAFELQQQLLKAVSEGSHVNVKVSDVENMDLSFLQLLLAWAKSMRQSGKNLIFDFQLNQEFVRIFDESGFRQAFLQL